ncbi:MAG: response regulator [Melioribacteraceae bacterium]
MENINKILIIEDDQFLQDLYRIFFKKLGAEIIVTEDSDEILELVGKGEIGLIIMDVNLRNTNLNAKRIDGIRFSRYIKEQFHALHIPILLVTAYPLSSFSDNLLEESLADDYLLKPIIDYNQLIEKINNLISIKI